jgi:four helix bundle protein
VEWVYNVTKQLPGSEQFGLTSQMRTVAVSVPTNITEGAARNHQKEGIQFCYISLGSHAEIETVLILSKNRYQLEILDIEEKTKETSIHLMGFIKHLKTDTQPTH